jgi:Chitin synthase export chaperone
MVVGNEPLMCIAGRVELRTFLLIYLITLPLQLITTGSLLTQGSTPLVVITAIHAGAVTALFWALLANGIVATQIVEDGTLSSLIVRYHPLP